MGGRKMMSSMLLGLLAETNLHPGSETTGGVIDLPVAREAITSYPVLMSSGLKGALRDFYTQKRGEEAAQRLFGKPDGAGIISISDGRLLLLPVRSLTSNYRWVTCPYILERLQRDLKRIGLDQDFPIPRPQKGQAIALTETNIYLEELSFAGMSQPEQIEIIVNVVKPLIYHESVQNRLKNQLVIVDNYEFSYFAQFGLPVNARNVLDDKTKTSTNLWYEETIPTDSIFYSIIIARAGQDDNLQDLQGLFSESPYIQLGGNETIGQGWCAISCWERR
jgi:CRISPR-associated protein Cmr4